VFLSGFEVNSSALYKAYNADCIQGAFVADQKVTAPTVSSEYLTKAAEMSKLVQRMYRNNQSINVKLFM
jgi:hypothetical protein